MQNVTNKVCLLLRKIFTVVKNLFETRVGKLLILRLSFIINMNCKLLIIKLDYAFFRCTCLRVSFFIETFNIDAYRTNFAGW